MEENKITPIEISKHNFKKSLFGYNTVEVDAFINNLSEEIRKLSEENKKYQQEINELSKKLQEQEILRKSIESAAVAINNSLEEIKTKARKEADLIIQQAKLKAEEIIHDSHKKLFEIEKQIEELKKEKYLLIKKLKNFIDIHRDILYSFENDKD